ncbi:peptidase [Candidatus Poribacteria bacterium]|nr:peptidase [Candidatus Poribacteria bacterium]
MSKTVRPYGEWPSPVTSEAVASAGISIGQIGVDGSDIYWVERRPADAGRCVLVRRTTDGPIDDVTDAPWNVRTRAHEYGGGDFLAHDEVVYFSQDDDQRLYRLEQGGPPVAITPPGPCRYADATYDAARGRIVCVREDHTGAGEPETRLVSIDAGGSGEPILFPCEHDFVSSPRVSPCGGRLAWLTWDHPNMPWDGTTLWVADLDADGRPAGTRRVAGGDDESVFQPEWSPSGDLYFVSDRTGWWNLYRHRAGADEHLLNMDAEFGRPQWVFGMSTYAVVSDMDIVCSYTRDGRWTLLRLDVDSRERHEMRVPYTQIAGLRAGDGFVVFRGASPSQADSLVVLDLATAASQVVRASRDDAPAPGMVSAPEAIRFPTEGGKEAHAYFYAPANADYEAPEDEAPPLIVIIHGGPTSATTDTYSPSVQYWTTRGYAVLDVNYGGSTGYGREYRERLRDAWGIVDVDDCVNGARHMADIGRADGDRFIIRGGSAGGYSTLAALTFRDVFRVGCSRYGISDLAALAHDTHKFEARYLDRLIGPYPEAEDIYAERSPIHSADRLSCPVIFLQGLDDKVVPPNQAERMVDILRDKGIPVAYVAFEGEGHGFHRAENIAAALDAEQYFYARVLEFEPADDLAPTPIDSLRD